MTLKALRKLKNTVDKATRKASQVHRIAGKPTEEDFLRKSGGERAFSARELAQLMGMDYIRFSHLLPYRYFDEEDCLFINTESLGFACELAPLSGANEEVIQGIAEMIKDKLDHTVCVQVMLVGGSKLSHYLPKMASNVEEDGMFASIGISQRRYLTHAAVEGFSNRRGSSMPLRDYRCFLFVSKKVTYTKANAAFLSDLRDEMITELGNAGIPSLGMSDVSFIGLVKELVNRRPKRTRQEGVRLDCYKELHEQVADPNFTLRVSPTHVDTEVDGEGGSQVVSLSLRELPDEIALWRQADNFSNIFKPHLGITCPFVISAHFKCEPNDRSKLKAFKKASGYEKKANSPYAKLIPGTVQAAEDWKKVRQDLASGSVELCKVYYTCTLFTDESSRRDDVSNALSSFRANGMDMYSIKYQQLQSYLAIMPFVVEQGLWYDLALLGRLNTMTTWNLSNLLPLVADYKGDLSGKGVLSPTFRGQIARIDNFSPRLDNYNVCITATSGSGKSVLSQSMISAVLSDGGKVWVIDLGQSYKKFCETLEGTYLDVSNLRLNPFSGVTDICRSAESIRDLIAVMASPNEGLCDVQKAHLLDAVIYAYKEKGNQATIDEVLTYLSSLNKEIHNDLRIGDMVTLLKKFSPTESQKGSLASRIFNESSDLSTQDIKKERFVVLELGELENQPDLLKAVLFALILHIEEKMYQGDQNRKKMCVIDEAWRLLSGSNATAASFIEKGFRTARKHRGSFMTITQSITDFYASSEAKAAWSCAENKIVMRQNEKSFKDFIQGHPDYFDDYEESLIQNFRSSSENGFSEFMVQQGGVSRFHRLFLDPFSRVMFSSRAEEHQAVQSLVREGELLSDAIWEVADNLYHEEIGEIDKVCDRHDK